MPGKAYAKFTKKEKKLHNARIARNGRKARAMAAAMRNMLNSDNPLVQAMAEKAIRDVLDKNSDPTEI